MNSLSVVNGLVLTSDIFNLFGYRTHRALKKLINSHMSSFIYFGDARVVTSKTLKSTGGRPLEAFALNLDQLMLLSSLVKNSEKSKKIEISKMIIEAYSNSSLLAVLELIQTIDVSELDRDRYIYVAKESVTGRIKIGISYDPESRVKALNVGNPEKLILIHSYKANESGYQSEVIAHKLFEKDRLHGEWFSKSIDVNLLPNYSATCTAENGSFCDCIECKNNSLVHDSVIDIEPSSRDCLISIAIKKTKLNFETVAKHVDDLKDMGVIDFTN